MCKGLNCSTMTGMNERYWDISVSWAMGPFATAEEAREFVAELVENQWEALEARCDHGPDYTPEECSMPEFMSSQIGEPVEIVDEEE